MRKEVERSAMIRLFEEIRDAFPRLSMQLDENPPNVDLNVDIPQQPALAFDMNLNPQGDELHLSAGAFWLEWFPCTRPDVIEAYREAVHGLLSGTYRIREHHRRQTVQGGAPEAGRPGLADDRDLARVGLAVSATHCREGSSERDYAFVRRLALRSNSALVARNHGAEFTE
jgi:hypothetical protein